MAVKHYRPRRFTPVGKRTGNATEGGQLTFGVEADYLVPEDLVNQPVNFRRKIFREQVKGFKKRNLLAAVIYTEVRPYRWYELQESCCRLVEHDLGLVGFQQMEFFSGLESAKTSLAVRKKTISYDKAFTDIFLLTKAGEVIR